MKNDGTNHYLTRRFKWQKANSTRGLKFNLNWYIESQLKLMNIGGNQSGIRLYFGNITVNANSNSNGFSTASYSMSKVSGGIRVWGVPRSTRTLTIKLNPKSKIGNPRVLGNVHALKAALSHEFVHVLQGVSLIQSGFPHPHGSGKFFKLTPTQYRARIEVDAIQRSQQLNMGRRYVNAAPKWFKQIYITRYYNFWYPKR